MLAGLKSFFVVDDSQVLRERLVEALGELPHLRCGGIAATVAESAGLLRAARPDIVILDIHLPDGSGMAVLDELRTWERPPAVYVFTNYDNPGYRRRFAAAGATGFFHKGTQFDALLAALAAVSAPAEAARP